MKINKNLNIKRKTAGITLIALVITIIVLLILAGISINMLSGDNGILNQAGRARDMTGENSLSEKIQIAILSALTKDLGSIKNTVSIESELNNVIGSENYTISPDSKTNNVATEWIVTIGNDVYEITSSGEFDKYEKEGEFYIYHTGVSGGNIETINMKSLTNGTYDLTQNITNGTLYGGYYLDYTNKETGLVYDGTNATWSNPRTESGMEIHPKPGRTYYIKEVPNKYMKPIEFEMYDQSNDLLHFLDFIEIIDDKNYIDVGFQINGGGYKSSYKNICKSNGRNYTNGYISYTVQSLGYSESDFLCWYLYFDCINMNYSDVFGAKNIRNYWVTPDSLRVTSNIMRRYIIKDANEDGNIQSHGDEIKIIDYNSSSNIEKYI